MYKSTVHALLLLSFMAFCECYNGENDIEARGKKKKIAIFVYIADLILKKFFILKLIYAFVFWVVLHKAGYFLTWFISSLKEKKHHVHHDFHHEHHDYHQPSYGYGPYRRQNQRSF